MQAWKRERKLMKRKVILICRGKERRLVKEIKEKCFTRSVVKVRAEGSGSFKKYLLRHSHKIKQTLKASSHFKH